MSFIAPNGGIDGALETDLASTRGFEYLLKQRIVKIDVDDERPGTNGGRAHLTAPSAHGRHSHPPQPSLDEAFAGTPIEIRRSDRAAPAAPIVAAAPPR